MNVDKSGGQGGRDRIDVEITAGAARLTPKELASKLGSATLAGPSFAPCVIFCPLAPIPRLHSFFMRSADDTHEAHATHVSHVAITLFFVILHLLIL